MAPSGEEEEGEATQDQICSAFAPAHGNMAYSLDYYQVITWLFLHESRVTTPSPGRGGPPRPGGGGTDRPGCGY